MEITIKLRDAYGRTLIDPVCDKAKIFAEMVNKKTLTPSDLQSIEKLGYRINHQGNSKSWREVAQ
jgi:hypothetical protein